MKFAVTVLFPVIVTVVLGAVPDASPLQFVNTLPAVGEAVSDTTVPRVYCPVEQPVEFAGEASMVPAVDGLTALDNI